ncbi:hypothetical protein MMC07_008400 [Pseudocyphellaria aurata]|nr:hypothetical protein [Pseudocyphellaria aurata]
MAPPQIHITTTREKQIAAARALSAILDTLGIRHAILGGFAVALYGGRRRTKDIDVLVDIPAVDIQNVLWPRVSEINGHFAQMGLRYYFVPRLVEGLEGEQLILANEDNTLVETLPTNNLGLPMTITPGMIYHGEEGGEGFGLPIVHPSILVLTKLKRWANISKSTYPPSMVKAETDLIDITFLIDWLAQRGQKISVPAYNAAVPERLYDALRTYEDFLKEKGKEGEEDLAKFMAVS